MPGAFLTVKDNAGNVNVMTIGWLSLGIIWSIPVLNVLVRPSRYTYQMMENAKYFSVNAGPGFEKELAFCGSHSGRDLDKIAKAGFKLVPGKTRGVSVIENCGIFYECEIIHKTKIIGETLPPDIKKKYYPSGDFHAVYSGKILCSYKHT